MNHRQHQEAIFDDCQDRQRFVSYLGGMTNLFLRRGAKRKRPRDGAIHLAREMSGRSRQELDAYFGGITGAGIGFRCHHMEKVLATDRSLTGDVKRVTAGLAE